MLRTAGHTIFVSGVTLAASFLGLVILPYVALSTTSSTISMLSTSSTAPTPASPNFHYHHNCHKMLIIAKN
jgi:hypothetical protein